jgi:hypothetical protein
LLCLAHLTATAPVTAQALPRADQAARPVPGRRAKTPLSDAVPSANSFIRRPPAHCISTSSAGTVGRGRRRHARPCPGRGCRRQRPKPLRRPSPHRPYPAPTKLPGPCRAAGQRHRCRTRFQAQIRSSGARLRIEKARLSAFPDDTVGPDPHRNRVKAGLRCSGTARAGTPGQRARRGPAAAVPSAASFWASSGCTPSAVAGRRSPEGELRRPRAAAVTARSDYATWE